MKKRVKALLFTIALLFPLIGIQIHTYADTPAGEDAKTVDVMFLHDTHSHLNAFATVEDSKSQVLGGFSRIKTLIDEQKNKNPDTLLLDAGDFSMGTLIQVIYETEASELRMLGELGMNATTLGNHEFDYKAKGLVNMLNVASASGEDLPQMLVCNIDWENMMEEGLTEEQELLLEAFDNYGVKDYMMVEKNGVNIAVIGVFGIDALACVPNSPLEFEDPVEAVQETVAKIKEKENADMIVCISHSGTWEKESKSEDEILAKEVPELDVIISGHTHTKLDEPIVHGNTYVVSAGEYGKYLGKLSMTQKSDGRWNMASYELRTVDESIPQNEATQKRVDAFMSQVNDAYLQQFGYTYNEVICTNEVEFATAGDVGELHTELNLGSMIADAYVHAVEHLFDFDGHEVDVAVVPAGTVRDTYALGEITPEKIFNSFSLGIGEDGIPGYPLISVYLTGKELKTVAEIDASISDLMTTARLYTNGLHWTYNPNRMLLNKVTDVYLYNGVDERVELEDEKLYRVVTDFYSSQMLGGVTDLSYGLLSIVPKYEDGTPITDYTDAIIMSDGKELKAWVAIARYMESFEDTDGDAIGNIPTTYAQPEGRKVVEDSKNIVELLKNPNKFFFMIIGVVFIVLALVGIILNVIRKLIVRRNFASNRNHRK